MNAWHNNWIRKWNERLCSLIEGSQLWPMEHLEWEYVMLKYEMLQFSECAKHDHAKRNIDTIFCSGYTFGICELMHSVKNMILILLVWMQIYICVLQEWGPFRSLSIESGAYRVDIWLKEDMDGNEELVHLFPCSTLEICGMIVILFLLLSLLCFWIAIPKLKLLLIINVNEICS